MDSQAPATDIAPADDARSQVEPVVEDLLVEDVSIDGMCGVY
ncbi:mycofactocin precursor MftA [Frankia nepalensis]|uniref:Mycofactocin n=1 Tax=Frankia nepalensis TaxID=1836974 RepID=A0A937UQK5_9ACTN|nr:mycofactocin precursor MftA [Frankia nepalensis]MBL7499808.1 mycofactocin precursor [Frankia nepalensis]MBL7511668.1 mycofactocin precursor [Frankia nepalensis]MBL7628350.1 mycofactocin precursor [Frankia nepalensis]